MPEGEVGEGVSPVAERVSAQPALRQKLLRLGEAGRVQGGEGARPQHLGHHHHDHYHHYHHCKDLGAPGNAVPSNGDIPIIDPGGGPDGGEEALALRLHRLQVPHAGQGAGGQAAPGPQGGADLIYGKSSTDTLTQFGPVLRTNTLPRHFSVPMSSQ